MEKKNYKELLNYKQFMKLLVANNINRFGDALDMIVYSWIKIGRASCRERV